MDNNDTNNPLCDELSCLLVKYHDEPDEIIRKQIKKDIVAKMIPVVKHLARTIARRADDPVEDLIQSGFIGVLKAIDNFSIEKGVKFRVYAGYLIIGEIKHFLRDKMGLVHIPRHIQELSVRIYNFTKNLTDEELEKLTKEEVAYALEVEPKKVDFAMDMNRRGQVLYFEDMYNQDSSYEEFFGSKEYDGLDNISHDDVKIMVDDVIKVLPETERKVIEMYYNEDKSGYVIAHELGYTEMRVGRIIKRACKKIYDYFEGNCKLSDIENYKGRAK